MPDPAEGCRLRSSARSSWGEIWEAPGEPSWEVNVAGRKILALAGEPPFCAWATSEGWGLHGSYCWLTHSWRSQQSLNGPLSWMLKGVGGIRAPSWGNRTFKIPSSLDFGDSVSRTASSDSPGLGWQVHSTCTFCCWLPFSSQCCTPPKSWMWPQRTTSQLIRAALSGPALRMSNQTSW